MSQQRVASLALLLLSAATPARAQSLDPTPETKPPIELDGSIGPGGDVPFDGVTWSITDTLGQYRGESLFHSFGRFDVPGGQIAEFSAVATPEHALPERVFARVTWGERSDIEGTLRSTIAGADLYLINPAGVRFEGGAQLDVQGSFHVTSAGRIDFSEGKSFTAFATDPPPLLTIEEPSSYGFLPEGGGAIEIGVLDQELSVPGGRTFDLVGGEIDVFGGARRVFFSPGSRFGLVAAGSSVDVVADLQSFDPTKLSSDIELGQVSIRGALIGMSLPAGSLLVRGGSLHLEGSGISANHNGVEPTAFEKAIDIAVRDQLDIVARSTLNVISGGTTSTGINPAGEIDLSGGAIHIAGFSEVLTSTAGDVHGSDLVVRASSLDLSDGGRLRSETRGRQAGGSIDVGATELSLTSGSRILSEARNAGKGGAIHIDASRIDANDAGFSATGTAIASTTTGALGVAAGNISIDADSISLRDGAQIFSSTSGSGNAGAVRVNADEIALDGRVIDPSDPTNVRSRAALIETRALPGSTGLAGELQLDGSVLGVAIETGTLTVSDGAEVGTATQGLGAAGDLVLDVSDSVLLEGGASGPATLQSRATAALGNPAVGAGGLVRIATPLLELRDGGQITSATTGTGDAGTVEIDAGTLKLAGSAGQNESGIFAQTLAEGLPSAGSAGGVAIATSGDVELRDGARISVETRNDQPAGNIAIDAQGQLLLDGASISAEATATSTAAGGSIEIAAEGGVVLRNGALIEASSRGTDAAGSVEIDAGPRLEMNNSSISTESITEDNPGGGQIRISADDQIRLTDSSINTSVAAGGGDGGDIHIDPELMLVNRSQIRADAFDGNGGRIFIRADNFVMSASSAITASSRGPGDGVDGVIVIDSPEAEVSSERAEPAAQYLDVAGLLRTSCGAAGSQAATFVVATVAGLPASPEGPLPAPLWDALAEAPAVRAGAAPISSRDLRSLRVAALAGGCDAQEEL